MRNQDKIAAATRPGERVTARGGIRLTPPPGMQPVACESLSPRAGRGGAPDAPGGKEGGGGAWVQPKNGHGARVERRRGAAHDWRGRVALGLPHAGVCGAGSWTSGCGALAHREERV